MRENFSLFFLYGETSYLQDWPWPDANNAGLFRAIILVTLVFFLLLDLKLTLATAPQSQGKAACTECL